MNPITVTATVFALAVFVFGSGCRQTSLAPKIAPTPLGTDALLPSPRLTVGRIIDIDPVHLLAFVELSYDAPPPALVEGTELITRTLELRETGRLRASRYLRGRTLGTKIVAGQPSPTDEVVWHAP